MLKLRYPLLLNIIKNAKILHNYPEHIFFDLMMANSNSNVKRTRSLSY